MNLIERIRELRFKISRMVEPDLEEILAEKILQVFKNIYQYIAGPDLVEKYRSVTSQYLEDLIKSDKYYLQGELQKVIRRLIKIPSVLSRETLVIPTLSDIKKIIDKFWKEMLISELKDKYPKVADYFWAVLYDSFDNIEAASQVWLYLKEYPWFKSVG